MARSRSTPRAVVENFGNLQADWQAGKRSRHLRERRNVEGSGDAHYATVAEFERIRDYVRDMDRNETIVGPFVDRAVVNQIQTGFRVQPETGDQALDDDLKARFAEWAGDARNCDHSWELTFWQQCHGWLRQTYIDGDICALLTDGGAIQTIEGDRLRSPTKAAPNIVHGVEMSGDRRKIAFWFGADTGKSRASASEPERRAAFDAAGNPEIIHITNPATIKRFTQARGVSAFAPVFYRLSMVEDTQFATLVQRQLVSSLAFFMERTSDYQGGKAVLGRQTAGSAVAGDAGESTVEQVTPGMFLRGAKGEKLTAVQGNIPNPEYFPFIRLLLTEIGINIGVPLVLALMDASDTNFSGFRGAVDAARMGFRRNQKWFVESVLRKVWQWQVRRWLETPVVDGGLGPAARRNPNVLAARWTPPSWPYLQPLDDAKANTERMSTMQLSPAQFAREQGFEWDEHVEETVANWELAITMANEAAARINQKFPDAPKVHWRELLNLGTSDGMKSELVRATVDASSQQNGGNQ